MKQYFIDALNKNSIEGLQNIYKSDLHNHAGRGGNIQYIETWANVKIEPIIRPVDSLAQMQEWFENM